MQYLLASLSPDAKRMPIAPQVDGEPRSVLVLEDDFVLTLLYRRLFQMCGCQVDLASSAEQAQECLTVKPYDLILLDAALPGGAAAQVAKFARQGVSAQAPKVPIVAISSGDGTDAVQSMLDAGADRFLPKPILAQQIRFMLAMYGLAGDDDSNE